jgi:hypothetical protein
VDNRKKTYRGKFLRGMTAVKDRRPSFEWRFVIAAAVAAARNTPAGARHNTPAIAGHKMWGVPEHNKSRAAEHNTSVGNGPTKAIAAEGPPAGKS